MAMVRRYRDRDGRLWGNTPRSKTTRSWTLFALGVGGFVVQALGIVGQPARADETVSFIGMAMAAGFRWVGLTPGGAEAIYGVIWWSHSLLAFAFIAWIPYAKPFHMISSFANVVARDENAGARLPNVPADLDHTNAESLDDFTWKELSWTATPARSAAGVPTPARPTRSAGTSTRGT